MDYRSILRAIKGSAPEVEEGALRLLSQSKNVVDDINLPVPSQGLGISKIPEARVADEILSAEQAIVPYSAPPVSPPIDVTPNQPGGLSTFQKMLLGGTAAGGAALGYNAMNGGNSGGKAPASSVPPEMSRENFYPGYPSRVPDKQPQAPVAPQENASVQALQALPPQPKNVEQIAAEPTFDSEGFTNNTVAGLQQAQDQAASGRLANELGRASELIGSSIAGVKPIAQQVFTEQAKNSDKAVESFEQRAEKEKSDPKSAISAQFRDFTRKFGITVPSNMSAEAAAKIMPYAYQKFAAQQAQEARAEEGKLARANARDMKETTLEAARIAAGNKKEQKLTDKQTDFAEKIGKAVQNKEYEKYTKLHNVVSRMQDSAKNPSAQGDAALVYDFVKALDNESAVREGEISFVGAAASVPQRVQTYINRAYKGELLLPEQREEIMRIGKKSRDDQRKTWESSVTPALKRAERLGIDKSLILPEDMPDADPSEGKQPPITMVKVIPPGGGKAKLIPSDKVDAAVAAGGKVVQ
tara:strand:+ start:838 stop:2418 length:1581 start_codon:yes stop_codon:yes gene_type:complete